MRGGKECSDRGSARSSPLHNHYLFKERITNIFKTKKTNWEFDAKIQVKRSGRFGNTKPAQAVNFVAIVDFGDLSLCGCSRRLSS